MITIKRNTGWMGVASKIQIIINGEKVASISEEKTIEVELNTQESLLKATQFGVKSNEIIVRDGDILEINQTRFYWTIIPIIIAIQFLNVFIPDLDYRLITLLSVCVLIISIFFVKGFHIENINRDSQ